MELLEYLTDKRNLMALFLFLFFAVSLILINNVGNLYSMENSELHASNTVIINVLIYNGEGTTLDSVQGIIDSLNHANTKNTVQKVYFNYSTSDYLNSKVLSKYDVLIMPGGLSNKYLKTPAIVSKDLKKFVYDGKGYIGICAGSYAASNNVDGYYEGWGIAPRVNCKTIDYDGKLTISMTSYGSQLLNITNERFIYEKTGPAMYKTDIPNDPVALYTDNTTGYQNYAAIADDTYGSGRVMLTGPHPELNPQNPEILINMILWVSKNN